MAAMGKRLCVIAMLLASAGVSQQRETAQGHFDEGRALYEAHDDSGDAAKQAGAEFRRALQLDPHFAAALAYLGFLAADEDPKQTAKVEAIYRQALQMDPNCSEAHVGLARLHLAANHRLDASREYRIAVETHPDNRLACHELGYYVLQEGFEPATVMWQDAIRCGQTLIRRDLDDRDAHHALAQIYEHFHRWAEAEHEYREVLRIGQTDEDSDVWVYTVHNDVARMLEKQRRYPEAIQEYEALIVSEGVGDDSIAQAKARIEALKSLVK